jgi:hypothetical protein
LVTVTRSLHELCQTTLKFSNANSYHYHHELCQTTLLKVSIAKRGSGIQQHRLATFAAKRSYLTEVEKKVMSPGMVRVCEQNIILDDAIGSHACSLEALAGV